MIWLALFLALVLSFLFSGIESAVMSVNNAVPPPAGCTL